MSSRDGWSFTNEVQSKEMESDRDYVVPFLSYFVLVKVTGGFGFQFSLADVIALKHSFLLAESVNIVATPFAVLNPTGL